MRMIDNSQNSVEVLCDGGGEYGYGHIRRSYTLAKALHKEKYPVKFTVLSKSKNFFTPEFTSTNLDPVVQVLDLPYEIQPWVDLASKKNIPTVALDYFGDAKQKLTISIYEHRIPPPEGRRFSGLKYAIIRPEILQFAPAEIGNGIVVMIGGSDLNQVGESIALRLTDEGKKVYLIQGPGTKERTLADFTNVTVLHDPEDLESRMASCEWAVTNGGGSMMEMMCLGKAIHVVPQTNDELLLAEIVFNKGALLGIGLDSLHIPSSDEIKRVGKRAQELVDGKGVDRIIGLIRHTFSE